MSGFWIRQIRLRSFVPLKNRSEQFAFDGLGGRTCRRPVLSRLARPPRRAPPSPNPPVECSGFGFGKLHMFWN